MFGQRHRFYGERHSALSFLTQLDGDVLWDEPLAGHSTFCVGGPVAGWFRPRTNAALIEAVASAKRAAVPVFIVGGGSNVLFPDERMHAIAISTERLNGMNVEQEELLVQCGVPIAQLLTRLHKQRCHHLDFLAGLPGTVGGALIGNAGTVDHWIGDAVSEVQVLSDASPPEWIGSEACRFGYRTSGLAHWRAVLGAKLEISGDPFDGEQILSCRRATQPIGAKTAGCVFKNPDERSAGRLIEEAGLKGYQQGKARVSPKHANFIENLGGARSAEIRNIIDIVREKVYKFHRVLLELEIEVFDGWTREVVQAKPSGGDL